MDGGSRMPSCANCSWARARACVFAFVDGPHDGDGARPHPALAEAVAGAPDPDDTEAVAKALRELATQLFRDDMTSPHATPGPSRPSGRSSGPTARARHGCAGPQSS